MDGFSALGVFECYFIQYRTYAVPYLLVWLQFCSLKFRLVPKRAYMSGVMHVPRAYTHSHGIFLFLSMWVRPPVGGQAQEDPDLSEDEGGGGDASMGDDREERHVRGLTDILGENKVGKPEGALPRIVCA